MDPVLGYHIEQTSQRLDELRRDLHYVKNKLDELREFKIETIATARITSMVISAACGLITLMISTIVAIKYH